MKHTTSAYPFSIVIPTLNEEKYLPLLLKDLREQTFSEFEVIIVDANSKDKTESKARLFENKFRNFTFITSDKKNVSHQRNIGARIANSDWIIFLDADDRLPPYFLQGIKYFVESKNIQILTSWIETNLCNKKDKATATLINLYLEIQKKTHSPYIIESFICIKKSLFEKLKGFNEKITVSEGQDLLKRALKRKIKYVLLRDPKYIYSFRRFRKLGSFKSFQNFALIEIARLTHQKLSAEESEKLYPMTGGTYFEVKEKDRNRIVKIMLKTWKITNRKIKKPTEKLWHFISRNLF